MKQLVLLKNGKEIDLNEHPSLLAFFHANNRAISRINEEIKIRNDEVEELEERIKLHIEMDLPLQGLKSVRTRRRNNIKQLENRREAYKRNYLEVPDMAGTRLEDNEYWGARLGTDVPLDALHALKHAKEQGIFDEFQLCTPARQNTDPMIVGVAGGRTFYVASWS